MALDDAAICSERDGTFSLVCALLLGKVPKSFSTSREMHDNRSVQ